MMKPTRRTFLGTAALAGAAHAQFSGQRELDALVIAQRHRLTASRPTPEFFEGMLLGNGDVGVCVTVRPDALGLHIGKEDSWDIRVSEDHYQYVLKFREVLDLWKRAGEEAKCQGQPEATSLETKIDFLRNYVKKTRSSYAQTWPRPWPCGIVWIHWDSRKVRVVDQDLDIATGLYTLHLESDDLAGHVRRFAVNCFVNQETGHIAITTGEDAAPFLSVAYDPNRDADAKLPAPELAATGGAGHATFSGYQHFPAIAPTEAQPNPPRSPKDRNFALSGCLRGDWQAQAGPTRVFLTPSREQPFRLDLTLFTPRDTADNVEHARKEALRFSVLPFERIYAASAVYWQRFWKHSAVEFDDKELEALWYHNQYWLACCLREGKVAPGLFGNWTSGRIGTAWHGDYHMNYNTQQVFWGVFSSNHVDQHLPYVELCENLLPLSEAYAKEKFELPGAFFPHSAYPVPSQTIAYPVPPWGYEICETPWTVQSLWWHYLYTLDTAYLRRAYPMLRAASQFLAAYVSKGGDGKYHIIPSVSPENWGFTVDYRLNRDCIMDLALSEFVLKATAEAARILDTDAGERDKWREIGTNLAAYPTVKGPYGEVWADVVDAPPEYVYNVPVTLAPVFPGEQVGLGVGEDHLEIARRTARTVRLEGGNDVVFQPFIRARLGMLDVAWFKNEVRYCTLPNGIVNDRVRQIDGRYSDNTNYDFMMRMGVWTENLSLPGVLNECLLQSYTGTIRLFPNRTGLGPARFRDLRAAGAFLVSAAWDGKEVSGVTVLSEKGTRARVETPWGAARVHIVPSAGGSEIPVERSGALLSFDTVAGKRYDIGRL